MVPSAPFSFFNSKYFCKTAYAKFILVFLQSAVAAVNCALWARLRPKTIENPLFHAPFWQFACKNDRKTLILCPILPTKNDLKTRIICDIKSFWDQKRPKNTFNMPHFIDLRSKTTEKLPNCPETAHHTKPI